MNPKTLKAILFLLILMPCALPAAAQIGLKISLVNPRGDIGPTYRKGVGYDIYYHAEEGERWYVRGGIYYTTLQPRLDTFPIAMIQDTYVPVAFPGYTVYHKFYMVGIFVDQNFRVVNYKGFSADLGLGIFGGKAHTEYIRHVPGLLREEGNIDQKIVGLRGKVSVGYWLNEHINLYLEAMSMSIVATEWSPSFAHSNYGLGVVYHFKSRESDY